MCLIIASQSGVIPDEQLMKDAYDDNPHGWGIMWAENGRIWAVKGLRRDSMIRNVRKVKGKPFVLHTRWATHGKIGVSNCHPFKVTDDLWLAHNGVLKIDCPKKEMSDTWHFAQALKQVSEAYPFVLQDDYRKKLTEYVEKWIGYSNKVVMLRADGEILIANESAGVHYEGMWLSNANSLWKGRYPYAWAPTRYTYKPQHYQDALAAFASESDVIEFADEQQCDYCNETSKTLYRYEGCDICEECYTFEMELQEKWKDEVSADAATADGMPLCSDDQEDLLPDAADFATGLEDDEDYVDWYRSRTGVRTELDCEIDRLHNVVAIDRGNYRLEEVPFSTVN
jgi:predicted glutamine amidotransferase